MSLTGQREFAAGFGSCTTTRTVASLAARCVLGGLVGQYVGAIQSRRSRADEQAHLVLSFELSPPLLHDLGLLAPRGSSRRI
jgi:hypothetical protein